MFKIINGQLYNTKLRKFTKVYAIRTGKDKYRFKHQDGTPLATNLSLDRFVMMYWGLKNNSKPTTRKHYAYQN